MSKKKRATGFRDKVRANTDKQKNEAKQFGFLNLPEDVDMFNPEPGSKVLIDIVPYEVTDKNHPDRDDELEIAVPQSYWWRRPFKIHRNVANQTVVCPTSFGKRCPICELHKQRQSEGKREGQSDDDFKQEMTNLKAKDRVLYAVIPIEDDDHEEKTHIWEMSHYNFQVQLNEELEEDEENMAFPDIEGGYQLRIRFRAKKTPDGKRTYAETSKIDFEERDEDDPVEKAGDAILDEIPQLDKLLTVKSYDELFSMLYGGEEGDDEVVEEEEEETPKRKPRTTKKDKYRRQEELEEEEEENEYADDVPEEDEENEEEEEDEQPRRRTTRRKRKNA